MMMRLYSWFGLLGFMVVSASLLLGFRHDPAAPAINYAFNAGLYVAYMAVHYVMMTPWYKKLVAGSVEGSQGERRVYISVSVITWVLVIWFHQPLPGPDFAPLPWWVTYFGLCAFLLSLIAFVEGATFETMKGMLGVPGTEQTHTAGGETKLLTKGSYASVRHPLYRGAVFMGITSLLLHPNAAQAVWAVAIGLTFIAFIPIEERQLLKARGDEYRAYMEVTRYRIFRGIW